MGFFDVAARLRSHNGPITAQCMGVLAAEAMPS